MKKLVVCALCAALVVPTLAVSVQADDSKELVLYTWENMFPQEVLDGFEEETGIKVVYSNFDTDENMLEKLSMAKGGDYDVVVADDYIIQTAIEEGLVEKLDTSKLSGWENINPLYQGQFYDPNDEYTAPYGAGIPLIVYDPELVDIDIKGYNDLWDASLEDSIALTANYRVLNGITNLALGQDFNDQNTDDIAKTGEKLLELAPNVRLIQDDNTQDALLNGEASVAFLYTSQVTAALQENPDLKVVYPEDLALALWECSSRARHRTRMRLISSWTTSFSRKTQQNVSIISDITAQTKQQIPCLRIRTLLFRIL